VTTLVLFDLGGTLEDRGALRDGALDTLKALAQPADGRDAVLLALLSDFLMPDDATGIPALREEYYAILDGLGIRGFFEPVDRFVTLSTEVGAFKPAPETFITAITKAGDAVTAADTLFVTENRGHVQAARALGLRAVHLSPVGTADGEIQSVGEVLDLVP
jgi:FMN phosphatase YigB (HAD superfamily)